MQKLFPEKPGRRQAVLAAFFVTFLWSTSWVLIKIGLKEIPALTFAGLRYMVAFCFLLPLLIQPAAMQSIRNLKRADWRSLVVLGVVYYALVQGTQFLGLQYLPAMTVSIILNLTAAVVAGLGIYFLSEIPVWYQWMGLIANLAGIFLYFFPAPIEGNQTTGMIIMVIGLLSNAAASLMGRKINREARIPVLLVTAISMGIGAVLMLGGGILYQGFPRLSADNWLLISWLALVNTAFAFLLWNYALRTISAMESSIINGTMLVQIAILAWVFLGERPSTRQIAGLALAACGAVIVQIRLRRKNRQPGDNPADGSIDKTVFD